MEETFRQLGVQVSEEAVAQSDALREKIRSSILFQSEQPLTLPIVAAFPELSTFPAKLEILEHLRLEALECNSQNNEHGTLKSLLGYSFFATTLSPSEKQRLEPSAVEPFSQSEGKRCDVKGTKRINLFDVKRRNNFNPANDSSRGTIRSDPLFRIQVQALAAQRPLHRIDDSVVEAIVQEAEPSQELLGLGSQHGTTVKAPKKRSKSARKRKESLKLKRSVALPVEYASLQVDCSTPQECPLCCRTIDVPDGYRADLWIARHVERCRRRKQTPLSSVRLSDGSDSSGGDSDPKDIYSGSSVDSAEEESSGDSVGDLDIIDNCNTVCDEAEVVNEDDPGYIDDSVNELYRDRLELASKRIFNKQEPHAVDTQTIDNSDPTEQGSAETKEESQENWKLRELTTEFGTIVDEQIWNEMYEYQRDGCRWMFRLFSEGVGGILGDEMGLGKTCQLCVHFAALARHYWQQANLDRANPLTTARSDAWSNGMYPIKCPVFLVVCPATVLVHWRKELWRWVPWMRVIILHAISGKEGLTGGVLSRRIASLRNRSDTYAVALLVTYDGLRSYSDVFNNVEWTAVCLDEGQRIRNHATNISRVCKMLPCYHRMILSGTPIQNSLLELWSLFDFVYPGRLGSLPSFQVEFCDPIRSGGYANSNRLQRELASRIATSLQRIVRPYLLRRRKDDLEVVTQLPKKMEQVLFCKLAPMQRMLYKQILDSPEVKAVISRRGSAFSAITTLRKLCNHPCLAFRKGKVNWSKSRRHDQISERFNKRISIDRTASDDEEVPEEIIEQINWEDSGKLLVLSKILPLWHKEGHKVLLFSQTQSMLNLIEKLLRDSFDFRYLRLDGSTNIGQRQRIIDLFTKDRKMFIMLLTTRTGGVGISLTAANRVIILDPDWNPQTDAQARERAWRIGQKREVTIYRMITRGTIEEKIYQRQIYKVLLSNRILEDPKQKALFAKSDIKELFTLTDEGDDFGSILKDNAINDHSLPVEGNVNLTVSQISGDQSSAAKDSDNQDQSRDRRLLKALFDGEALTCIYDHSYLEQGGKSTSSNALAAQAERLAKEAEANLSSSKKVFVHEASVMAISAVASPGVPSAQLLSSLRARNSASDSTANQDASVQAVPAVQDVFRKRLLESFARNRGMLRTDVILRDFQDVGDQYAVLFRNLLREIAMLRDGIWTLKEK